jgi:glycosyltransferase involved in cell wall biosynthesis
MEMLTMENGVLFSGFKWSHHDARSGYHQVVDSIADYVDGDALWGGDAKIDSRKRKWNFLLAELITIFRARHYRAVFYLYPEQSTYFFSAPILKWMGKRVIYPLHLGKEFWDSRSNSLLSRLKRRNLKFVDCFVVLSNQQQQVFERYFPGKVRMIPHGVWLDMATNVPQTVASNRVCVVGDNYRDYVLLSRIIELFAQRFPGLEFDLVGMKYAKLGAVAHLPTVTCHSRLSEIEYVQTIAGAAFMLLPLEFATANNALLEALALGVPVLCNRIDGVIDYLPDENYVFDDVEQLCAMVEVRMDMGLAQRSAESAELVSYVQQQFSWPVVRQRIVALCLHEEGRDGATVA